MPFEDRLGEAVRRTGDSFEPEDQPRLVELGVTRGRRRLARRRTTVVTSGVLALAVAGLGGAYAGDLIGGDDVNRPMVAAPNPLPPVGEARVSGEQMTGLLKSLLPEGDTTREQGRGWGNGAHGLAPHASVVFDDGSGAGLVGISVSHVDPSREAGERMVTCPAEAYSNNDACTQKTLPDGSRFMLLQGYEYPDRRRPTKDWRAVRLTPDGVLVDVQEWNAPAEKGAEVTRENPPLSPAELKAVATSGKWVRVGEGRPVSTPPPADESGMAAPSAEAIRRQLVALLPKVEHFEITERGGQSGFAYIVVDDGRGRSLIQINVQSHMSDVVPRGQTSTLPDGTRVGLQKQPGEKGGAGVVMWTADTVHPDGFRVVISAFNTGGQHNPATRPAPALTLEALKKIALADGWRNLT